MKLTRPDELIRPGLSRATIYRRAKALNLSYPFKFTDAEVKKILAFPDRRVK